MKSRLTTLCYIEKDDQYLMLHRVSKKNDINKDKWIGVGGHFEEGESPEECLLREVKEETGLTLTDYRFRGIVTFCAEGHPTEYMCLYTADGFTGTLKECDEGRLEWVEKCRLKDLNLWDGDFLFLDLLWHEEPFFSLKLGYHLSDKWNYAALNGEEMELFDLCREDGTLTGHVKERSMVHRDGDFHRTVHIWIIRKREDGGIDVLLQKRSKNKDAFPGCYDISSAGHVRTEDDYETSALRELSEELGIEASREELRFIGLHEGYTEAVFWGNPFQDWELSAIYLYEKPIDAHHLSLQENEVEAAVFMDYDRVLSGILDGSIPNCIFPEEFKLIKRALEPGFGAQNVRITEKRLLGCTPVEKRVNL
ncbi:MAG: NUDIX domain-containing protein [Firmicutes bacterium]|nr:NUDIX domain-containing protein [Bacillota bacterium]